jgi:hypothetical protein
MLHDLITLIVCGDNYDKKFRNTSICWFVHRPLASFSRPDIILSEPFFNSFKLIVISLLTARPNFCNFFNQLNEIL